MRPGARAYFVLDDFDSYVSPSQLDPKEIVPLDTAKAKKLSDGNPMSGAYLNADSTDPQNLVYMDTLMDLPATVDSSGKVVAFKLRSQMTRKLNSYDWDVVNGTSRFDDAPLVENAEWEDDKEFVRFHISLLINRLSLTSWHHSSRSN